MNKIRFSFIPFYLLVIAFSFVPLNGVIAQQPTPSDDEVNVIARQLFCPVCENTPLDVCPTQACQDWRELIRQMLAEGKTPNQIKQYFVDHYGARVLSEPPQMGLNWLVYVIPPLAFLAGVYLLFRAFWIWKRPGKETQSKTGNGSGHVSEDVYINRFEEELLKRK